MTADGSRLDDVPTIGDVVHDYLRAIRSTPVLPRETVDELCRTIEVGVLAAERAAGDGLSAADRLDLAVLRRRGRAAERRLVAHNLKLVVSIARKASSRSIDFEDLIQAGNAGLLTAVQRFDWTLGFAFSTYASWWIRKAVSLEVANDRTIRLPAGPLRELLELTRIERESAGDAAPATARDLAAASGLDPDRVAALRRVGAPVLSLTQPLTSSGETVLMDVLPADAPELADSLHDRRLLDEVAAALDELPPLDRSILEQRYGLSGNPPRSPQRIAQLIHLRVAEIAALEQAALDRLGRRLRHLREC